MTTMEDEIRAMGKRVGPTCRIQDALTKLGKRGPEFVKALANPELKGSEIARWLKANGIDVKQTTVQRHRNGECACGKA